MARKKPEVATSTAILASIPPPSILDPATVAAIEAPVPTIPLGSILGEPVASGVAIGEYIARTETMLAAPPPIAYVKHEEPVAEPSTPEDDEVEAIIARQVGGPRKKLPVLQPTPEVAAPPASASPGSSAASTVFCSARVSGPGGHLHVDGNQKITADNGSYDDPRPNALSIVQIEDCPHSTEICRASCYVHGLEKGAPATHALYRHNSTMIRRIVKLPVRDRLEWAEILGAWISANCAGGFRWHVSGDIISREHSDFIAAVVGRSANVEHWIYTRSFPHVTPSLLANQNLAINLSCDRKNLKAARDWIKVFRATRGAIAALRLAYLCDDGSLPELEPGSVIFPDYGLRGRDLDDPRDAPWWATLTLDQKKMVCPTDFFGKSEHHRCGPCRKCLP